ncbi:MAG: hypothetical protein NT126_11640 [Bacteroidetes bacterium]|nr:hypothetical protein [Bacteroidota bacterium]
MRSALLHYPFGEVFKSIEKVCDRNDFRITSSNEKKGEVTAERGRKIFGNKVLLHIKIEKREKLISKVNVTVLLSGIRKTEKDSLKIEEKIVDTVYKLF